MDLKKELEEIRLKNGGLLTEEAILAEAKSKKHPLHEKFTWDNSEAARQWRLEEARVLIRSVYVTIERNSRDPVTVRAYASLPTDRMAGGGYRSITDVMANKDLRREMLSAALSELDSFKTRYSNLTALEPIFMAIDAVKIKKVVRKTTTRRPAKRKPATASL